MDMEERPGYERHVFVCINEKEEGRACCASKGMEILLALRKHVNENQLFHRFNVSKAKCLGHCKDGPTVAIYPEGGIFTHVSLEDVPGLIERFLE